MSESVSSMIMKPFTVFGQTVTAEQIGAAICRVKREVHANGCFIGMDLNAALLPEAPFIEKQEASNRLLQRWRKLGIVGFSNGRWFLARNGMSTLLAALAKATLP